MYLLKNRNLILDDYYMYLIVLKAYAKRTSKTYLKEADRLIYFLYKLKIKSLSEIKKNHIEKFIIAERKKRKISNVSTNLLISCINNFTFFLFKKHNFCENTHLKHMKAASKIPKMINSKKMVLLLKEKYPLNEEKNWLKIRDYAIGILIYSTGMRVSEVIDFSMYDVDNEWIRVVNGKGMKSREVPTNKLMHEAIRRYIDCCPFSMLKGFWFNRNGKKMTADAVGRAINTMFGFSPHYFRHAFATHLVRGGCELMVLKDFLGHSSLHTTSIYTHVEPQHLVESVNNFHPMSSIRINKNFQINFN
ncbi:MAG: tyrosine-type recombinase/integrase [Helicobacteraceae bacterium]|nr:tyrosine-type recombinase/integrase [Helicobacteraceae bacterium]